MAEIYSWDAAFNRKQSQGARPVGPVLPPVAGDGDRYGLAGLDAELAILAATPERKRNDQLNTSAFNLGQLVPGHLSREYAEANLYRVALSIGLDTSEIPGTIRSGIQAGMLLPRTLKELPEIAATVTEVAAGDILPPGPDGAAEGLPEETTWDYHFMTVASQNAAQAPEPMHLVRTDGQALLYTGKVNGLIGESESGKSWLALLAVIQAVAAGKKVLILDFEDSPASVMERLVALQVDPEHLAGSIGYCNPQESLGLLQSASLSRTLAELKPDLIVVDGVNAAMTLLGLDINDNGDATRFAQRLLRPLAATGACVVTVDHVPKSIEARGKGGIGAQAKRAMIDGACLRVEIIEPFGKGQSGELKVTVDKDRPGRVRGISAGGKVAGRCTLTSIADVVEMFIEPASAHDRADGPPPPTYLMEQVSRLLEGHAPMGQRAILEATSGKRDYVRDAVLVLIERGYLATEEGPRRSILHRSVRPYREGDESTDPRVPPLLPGVTRERRQRVFPTPPLPTGGEHSAGNSQERSTKINNGERPVVTVESNCNDCGVLTPGWVIEKNEGYCTSCERRR